MPKPRSIEGFPIKFFDLISAVAKDGRIISIKLKSRAEAEQARSDFYSFRKSLANMPGQEDVSSDSKSVMMTIKEDSLKNGGSFVLTFQNRDKTPFALALNEALDRK